MSGAATEPGQAAAALSNPAARHLLPIVLLLPLLLGGCASSVATQPDATQFRNTYNYLPVNDLPQDEQRPVLTPAEQEKLRNELAAVRDRQVPAAPAKPTAAKPAAPKPAASPAAK